MKQPVRIIGLRPVPRDFEKNRWDASQCCRVCGVWIADHAAVNAVCEQLVVARRDAGELMQRVDKLWKARCESLRLFRTVREFTRERFKQVETALERSPREIVAHDHCD